MSSQTRFPSLSELSVAILEHITEPVIGSSAQGVLRAPVVEKQLQASIRRALTHTEKRFIKLNNDEELCRALLALAMPDIPSIKQAVRDFYDRPADEALSLIIYECLTKDSRRFSQARIEAGVTGYLKILRQELVSVSTEIRDKLTALAIQDMQESTAQMVKLLRDILVREQQERSGVQKDEGTSEREDAMILAAVGKLLTSLRALDNGIHTLVGQLTLFDLDWSKKRREQLITRINEFAHKEEIIKIIRVSLSELVALQKSTHEDDRVLVMAIFNCGVELLQALGDSPVTPFPHQAALRDFGMRIKKAKFEKDIQIVIGNSEKILGVLNRDRLAIAETAFGTLRVQILRRHPRLPKSSGGKSLYP